MTDVFATGIPALSVILPVTVVGLCADARDGAPSANTRPAMPANSMRDILAMFPTSRGLGGYDDWTGIAPPPSGDNDFRHVFVRRLLPAMLPRSIRAWEPRYR